jgi:hypothetical protein
VSLTEGYVDSSQQTVRGYGWAYISSTTDATKEEVGSVLTAEEAVEVEITTRQKITEKAVITTTSAGGSDGGQQLLQIAITSGGAAATKFITQQIDGAVDEQQAKENAKEFFQNTKGYGSVCVDSFNGSVDSRVLPELSQADCQALRQLDITDEQRAGLVSAYASLNEFNQDRLIELVELSDSDEVDFLAEADAETVAALVGGRNPDKAYQQAILRIASDDDGPSDEVIERVVREVDSQNGVIRLHAEELVTDTGGVGIEFIDEFETETLYPLFDYIGDGDAGMRRSLAELYQSNEISHSEVVRFSSDLETLRENDVDGVEHVIEDDIADVSDKNNVRGAMYEFRVANGYVEDVDDLAEIGWTRETVRFDELSSDQVDQIIKEIDFANAASREDKVDIIQDALNPDSIGRDSSKTELDILRQGDEYVEAKSGDVEYPDILDKIIRYKAHQLEGDLDSTDTMIVIAKDRQEFIDGNAGGPNKVAHLIENTRGVDWDILEW